MGVFSTKFETMDPSECKNKQHALCNFIEKKHYVKMFEYLDYISKNEDVNNYEVVFYLVSNGDLNVINKVLEKYDFDLNNNQCDGYYHSNILYCMIPYFCDIKMHKLFIKHGAKVNYPGYSSNFNNSPDCQTPLDLILYYIKRADGDLLNKLCELRDFYVENGALTFEDLLKKIT